MSVSIIQSPGGATELCAASVSPRWGLVFERARDGVWVCPKSLVFNYRGHEVLVFVLFVSSPSGGDFCLFFGSEGACRLGRWADGTQASAFAFGSVFYVQLRQRSVHKVADGL